MFSFIHLEILLLCNCFCLNPIKGNSYQPKDMTCMCLEVCKVNMLTIDWKVVSWSPHSTPNVLSQIICIVKIIISGGRARGTHAYRSEKFWCDISIRPDACPYRLWGRGRGVPRQPNGAGNRMTTIAFAKEVF